MQGEGGVFPCKLCEVKAASYFLDRGADQVPKASQPAELWLSLYLPRGGGGGQMEMGKGPMFPFTIQQGWSFVQDHTSDRDDFLKNICFY